MITVKVSSKGQIAIPKALRDRAGLVDGTELEVAVRGQDLVLRKTAGRQWRRWRGALSGSGLLEEHQEEHRQELRADEEGS